MQAVQRELGWGSTPRKSTHVKAEQPGSSSGYVGGIGILPHHNYVRLWWVMLAKDSKCICHLHLNLVMTTEGSHHVQVPLFHSVSNLDGGGSSFTTDPQTGIGDKLHPSLPKISGGAMQQSTSLILTLIGQQPWQGVLGMMYTPPLKIIPEGMDPSLFHWSTWLY